MRVQFRKGFTLRLVGRVFLPQKRGQTRFSFRKWGNIITAPGELVPSGSSIASVPRRLRHYGTQGMPYALRSVPFRAIRIA